MRGGATACRLRVAHVWCCAARAAGNGPAPTYVSTTTAVRALALQAPPSDRRYRAALATAIEPCGASFRRLIAAALTSESRLLRAAVVRVLARAAGGLG